MSYNIKIGKVIKYLQTKGWTLRTYGDLAFNISIASKGEQFEIMIPRKETLPDYEFRIEQLIKSLSSIEGRTADEIKGEIENIGFDVLNFRFIAEQYSSGMPLDDFTSAVDKIYDIFKFETCSELNPQSQYTNTYDEAKELLSHCEVPQTEKGSYIIKLKVPLGETYRKEIRKEDEYIRFLGRNTILRMLTGINEAKDINLTDEKEFRETYGKKLNRNTCKAIRELIDDVKGAIIEINTKWDSSKPVQTTPPAPKLTQKDIQIFETMETYLTKIPDDEEKMIQGKITDMRRSKENDKEQTITIYDINLNRNIYVDLKVEDYERACSLYAKISDVYVRGKLKRRARWVLENYRNFGIQPTL
jgi:hypothetical protein